MNNTRKFKGFKDAVEWMVYMKKARREYIEQHHTLDGFNPYAVQVPTQI